MADIKNVLKGFGFFFLSYFYIIIMAYLLPPLISAGEAVFSGLEGMIWFFVIIAYVILALVVPSAFIYRGLQNVGQGEDKIINALVGVLMFIFMMTLTVKGWFWVTTFASLTTGIEDAVLSAFITAIFWVGLVISWIEVTIATPVYLVIKALNN